MSSNTMIYAMLILIVALNMCKSNQENDSSTTLLYIILIGGIIFTLSNNNNNLINNTGNVMENLQTGDNTNNENIVNENVNNEDVNNEDIHNEYNVDTNANVNNEELQDEKITLTADDLLPANSKPRSSNTQKDLPIVAIVKSSWLIFKSEIGVIGKFN